MKISSKAKIIIEKIDKNTKLGDLRKIAKDIKKDHVLAMELWSSKNYLSRLLAILIMDKKLLSMELLDKLDTDMQNHPTHEGSYLMDWLMANQLNKDKKTIALMETWQNSASPLQRRAFWYYQGRLRWVGQLPPHNTTELFSAMEANIMKEEPQVQWAMNFTAGWIGVFDQKYRHRCIKLGEQTGLYKDEMVAKGCTPNYLPEFIRIEVDKRKLK